ncbi:MAG: hypothetical protein PVG71_05185 [Anaerolineae bacterium]|jgi:hypothetical protein
MRRETWLADTVEVTVSGVFRTRHLVQTATGILGELTMPALRRKAVFRTAGGRELIIERTSWWRGTYELREDGAVLGTARPLGIFRRENVVRFGDHDYRLRAAGFWGRIWHLVDDGPAAEGEIVVAFRPRGVFRRGAILQILSPVDLHLLVFAYYVVNARWQEQSAAAGAGAGAAAAS